MILLGLACSGEPVEPVPAVEPVADTRPVPTSPSIVLITIESTRADHLLQWGYARDTMSTVGVFSERGRRFDRAYSPAPWTLPSMASLFTGLRPSELGVVSAEHVVPDEASTLAEELSAVGYDTAFFGTNEFFDGHGLEQGFARYQNEVGASGLKTATAVRSYIDAREGTRPLFLAVHIFEPHCPYLAPKGLRGMHSEEPPGRMLTDVEWDAMGDCYRKDRDLGKTLAAYDEELMAADSVIDALWGAARPFRDDAIWIVTGDHGEAFWEHGDFGHGRQLDDEQIHVPLAVMGTGWHDVDERPVSTAWIAGSIREIAGLDPAGPTLGAPAAIVVSETSYDVERAVAISAEGRVMVDAETGVHVDGQVDEAAALAAIQVEARFTPQVRVVDEAVRARLRALGYAQ
ncbi:MAG: sulfatase [Proteobacteria bacterium]|nr:sulfatase [Pseudomonadota bacterium]